MRLGILISGRGSNLKSLIEHFGPRIGIGPVEIVLVISNKTDAPGLQHAIDAGIPRLVIDHSGFADRQAFDKAMHKALTDAGADFVALAGFMRILSREFIDAWQDRMVNIHPSLLPSFKGLDTHRQALAAGVRFHGCTVHFVRHELDSGPIIAQAVVPVLPGDDEASLASRVLKAEHRLYPQALRLIAEGKILVKGGHVCINDSEDVDGAWFNPPVH